MRRLILLAFVFAATPAAACPPFLDPDPDLVLEASSDGSTLRLEIRNVRTYAIETQSCPGNLDVDVDKTYVDSQAHGACEKLVLQPNESFVVTRDVELPAGSHEVRVRWMTWWNSTWPEPAADEPRLGGPPYIEATLTMRARSTPRDWPFALAVLGLAGAFLVGRRATQLM